MGMRIHKALGYALLDVEYNDITIKDERFIDNCEDKFEDLYGKEEQFLDFILDKNNEKTIIDWVDNFNNRDSHLSFGWLRESAIQAKTKINKIKLFEYHSEFGDPKVFFIYNFQSYEENYRYDNLMDYYESGRSAKVSIKNLRDDGSCGIYPWEGIYLKNNAKTDLSEIELESLSRYYGILSDDKKELKKVVNPGCYNEAIGKWDENASKLSNNLIKKLNNYYRVSIPESVIIWGNWCGLFKNFNISGQDLEPIIYEWWS